MKITIVLLCSYIADLVFGDPETAPHPTRGMGRLISFLDNKFQRNRINGILLAFIVITTSGFLAYLLTRLHPFLGIYLAYTTISIKDLQIKGRAILKMINEDIVKAQKELSKIVSRDTEGLNKERITIAAIESIAENTNDGIVAPLFYLVLGGPVGAIIYKAINTLDSMVGYKNERYLYFGWFSARLDDIANFIPARITGFLISISSCIYGKGFLRPFMIMIRDGRKHPSPNSGVSEAAMAGALGIRLGGPWFYQGEVCIKPYIGEEKRAIQPFLINEALKISFIVSFLMLVIGVILRWIF